MTGWADLHLHTTCSDGADTPERVMERAHELGIAAVAITDHDTMAGVAAARAAAQTAGMDFLEGVEISASFDGQEIHILGLGVREDAPVLKALLGRSNKDRAERAWHIVDRLDKIGVAPRATLAAHMEGAAQLGRMHVAVALERLGKVHTVQDAFERYLNRACPAFVPKILPPAADAVRTIHEARGLAFIAHPGLGHTLRRRLGSLLELPFDGIEAWHVSHTEQMVDTFKALAGKRGLLLTGGSDCHGDIKKEKPSMGRVRPPYACYEHIRDALSKLQ
jgi:predicted metal-dependent phosphoesterase TrpH